MWSSGRRGQPCTPFRCGTVSCLVVGEERFVIHVALPDGTFQRVDVTDWQALSVEKRGSTPSTWLQDPDDAMVRWLHKDTMIPASGNEQGEDWSEILSTQVARQLGVPVAPVRLCTRAGRR